MTLADRLGRWLSHRPNRDRVLWALVPYALILLYLARNP